MSKAQIHVRLDTTLVLRLDSLAQQMATNRNQLMVMLISVGVGALEQQSVNRIVGAALTERLSQPYDPGPSINTATPDDTPLAEPKVLPAAVGKAPPPTPPKRHFHKFTQFVYEAKPVKGERQGLYRCECGEEKTQGLGVWDAK